jgi:serine/threonine protein kinase
VWNNQDVAVAAAHSVDARRWIVAFGAVMDLIGPRFARYEPMGHAADIWGLGSVLYRALTGRRPFPGTIDERRRTHTADLKRLERVAINSELRRLIAGCLTVAPAERPSLDAVRRILDAFLTNPEPTSKEVGGW